MTPTDKAWRGVVAVSAIFSAMGEVGMAMDPAIHNWPRYLYLLWPAIVLGWVFIATGYRRTSHRDNPQPPF